MYSKIDIQVFLRESLEIEGIDRNPTDVEVDATLEFLGLPELDVASVVLLQALYTPHRPMRDQVGMNVRVGNSILPPGQLAMHKLLADVLQERDPWRNHVAFEGLHPFMDGNGRTGRTIWAWCMLRAGHDPFELTFLHRWYYQSLAALQAPRKQP